MEKQKRLDINWYAGVEDVVSYDIPGDHSHRKHSFVVKANKKETSDRLIQKTTDAGDITATYNPSTNKTTITFTLLKEDTYDQGGKNLFWDHRSDSATDPSDTKVPVKGNFNVEAATQTPFDGTDLPSDARRYIPLLAPGTLTGDQIQTAVDEAHTHDNKTILDNTEESYTTSEKNKLAGIEASAVALSTVKSDSEIASAITDDHTHSNKAVLDGTEESFTTNLKSTYDGYASSKEPANANIQNHIASISNPHEVTKEQVGLGNADNTSDTNKPISTAAQNALNLKADLVDGKIPSAQLPSFVDDVLEYDNLASFPVNGESGKIYVAKDTNLTYRWTGTTYIEISQSLALGETSQTAYRGDRGKTAYDHSQLTHDKNLIGLPNVDNTSDIDKPVSTAQQAALDLKVDKVAGKNLSTNDFTNDFKNNVIQYNALFDYLMNGNLDENNTVLSFDENNMILNIDEGVL